MSPIHLERIRRLPCCIPTCSSKSPSDPHHLRVSNERGVGLKATDRWAIPLCRRHHEECHTVGSRKEEEWFLAREIDCYGLANSLWQNTSDDLGRMLKVMEAHREHRVNFFEKDYEPWQT